MDKMAKIDELFENLNSKDGKIRYEAMQELIRISENKVEWLYDKWFVLLDKLTSENSFQRSIGLMLLANLAKSDMEDRMGGVLVDYLKYIEDEKFITSRQYIQNIWKIAVCNPLNCTQIVKELERTYFENIHLKTHGNLIKEDVIFSLCQIAKQLNDKSIFDKAIELTDQEIDPKLVKSLKNVLSKCN